ncbi:unnamed protein product, partial [Mesorhabditis spiculigera]
MMTNPGRLIELVEVMLPTGVSPFDNRFGLIFLDQRNPVAARGQPFRGDMMPHSFREIVLLGQNMDKQELIHSNNHPMRRAFDAVPKEVDLARKKAQLPTTHLRFRPISVETRGPKIRPNALLRPESASNMEFDKSLPAIEVPVPKWFLSWKEIYEMSPSRRHMSYEQELHNRQSAGQFMHLLTERLNQGFTEKWRKVSMLCACAALMHVNRVFTLHSFQDLDYRDVCAGAMLMTAKAEDCQRSLRQVVKAWWSLRFPTKPQIPDEYYDDAAHRIEFFESVVLQSL